GSLGALDDGAEKLLAVTFVVVQGAAIEVEHEEVGGFETGIDALRILHAANEKAGANQCNQRKSVFSDHQHAAESAACPSDGIAADTYLQDFDDVGARGLQ